MSLRLDNFPHIMTYFDILPSARWQVWQVERAEWSLCHSLDDGHNLQVGVQSIIGRVEGARQCPGFHTELQRAISPLHYFDLMSDDFEGMGDESEIADSSRPSSPLPPRKRRRMETPMS